MCLLVPAGFEIVQGGRAQQFSSPCDEFLSLKSEHDISDPVFIIIAPGIDHSEVSNPSNDGAESSGVSIEATKVPPDEDKEEDTGDDEDKPDGNEPERTAPSEGKVMVITSSTQQP